MSIPALIFDLDGLLVDSEPLHLLAYRSILADFGLELTQQEFVEGWLSYGGKGIRYYLEKMGIEDPGKIQAVRELKADRFLQIAYEKVKLMPGAKALLQKVKSRALICGIGTGAYRREYELMVEECGLRDYIEVVVGGNEVAKNKPSPDVFLKVAEKLNVAPEQCVVFENSNLGIRAARKAKMKCLVVPSPFTAHQDFSGADQLFGSLEEIHLEKLNRLLKG